MGSGMGWMWLFWLLLVVGLALLVLVAVRALFGGVTRGRSTQTATRASTAGDLLDERYARGELNTDEYRERLQALREEGSS